MTEIKTLMTRIESNPEFLMLREVGGCAFHREANALAHTYMVVGAMSMAKAPEYMRLVALLHDIGKIYVTRQKPNGDYEYPNHSGVGASDECLVQFVPRTHELFTTIQWYIKNHIKPLFWQNSKDLDAELRKLQATAPTELCSVNLLALLGACDITGSISEVEQIELYSFLIDIYQNWK